MSNHLSGIPDAYTMTEQFSKLESRLLRSTGALKRRQNAHNNSSDNSEDPYVAEEAQFLLSRFTKSSEDPQEGNSRDFDTVYGVPIARLSEKTGARPNGNWDTDSVLRRDDTIIRQRRGGDRIPNLSASQWIASTPSHSWQPFQARIHGRQGPQAASTFAPMPKEAIGGSESESAAVDLPSSGERSKSSQRKLFVWRMSAH